MKKILILAGIVVLLFTLAACNTKPLSNEIRTQEHSNKITNDKLENKDDKPQDNNTHQDDDIQNKDKITINDFDFIYKGVKFNDTGLLENILIAKPLLRINGENRNKDIKCMTTIGDVNYSWVVRYMPSREEKELIIETVEYNNSNNSKPGSYLVSAELLKVATSREVSVGDSLDKLKEAYGDSAKPQFNSDTTDLYAYKLNSDVKESLPDKALSFIVDKKTKKITKISINYNNNKAMNELNITSFD